LPVGQSTEQPGTLVQESSGRSETARSGEVGAPDPSSIQRDDPIRPRHYRSSPSGVECIDVVEHMTFNVGSAMKYLWRAGLKGGSPRVEDLKKAAWYINREIEKLTKESKTQ
jgi:hypothetical protein